MRGIHLYSGPISEPQVGSSLCKNSSAQWACSTSHYKKTESDCRDPGYLYKKSFPRRHGGISLHRFSVKKRFPSIYLYKFQQLKRSDSNHLNRFLHKKRSGNAFLHKKPASKRFGTVFLHRKPAPPRSETAYRCSLSLTDCCAATFQHTDRTPENPRTFSHSFSLFTRRSGNVPQDSAMHPLRK